MILILYLLVYKDKDSFYDWWSDMLLAQDRAVLGLVSNCKSQLRLRQILYSLLFINLMLVSLLLIFQFDTYTCLTANLTFFRQINVNLRYTQTRCFSIEFYKQLFYTIPTTKGGHPHRVDLSNPYNSIGYTHSKYHDQNFFISNKDLKGKNLKQYGFELTEYEYSNLDLENSIIETVLKELNEWKNIIKSIKLIKISKIDIMQLYILVGQNLQ